MVHSSISFGFASLAMSGSASAGTVFAGTHTAGESSTTPLAKVVYSVDGGVTWSGVASGDRHGIDGAALGDNDLRTQVVIGGRTMVYAGTGGIRGGVFKSSNMGGNWTDAALYSDTIGVTKDFNVVNSSNMFLVLSTANASETHTFRTTDAGVSWTRVSRVANISKVRTGLAPNTFWALRTSNIDGQVRRSTDGGNTWSVTPMDPSDTQQVVDFLAGSDLTAYAVMSNNQIAITHDGGASWTLSTNSPNASVRGITKSPTFGDAAKPGYNTLVAFAPSTGMVWLSRDGAISWTQYGAAPMSAAAQGGVTWSPTYEYDRLVFVAVGNATSPVSSDSGVYKLKDDGTVTSSSNWTAVTTRDARNFEAKNKIGAPVISGNMMWVPVGDKVAATHDVSATPVDWRAMPVVDPTGDAVTRVTVGLSGSSWRFWTWGQGNTLKVLSDTSGASTLLSPANGAGNVARVTALSWSAVPSATMYEVQLGLTPTLAGASIRTTSALAIETNQWYTGDGMTPGGTFFWRVRAYAPVTGPWTDIWSFSVAGGPTPLPATATPMPDNVIPLKAGWNLVSLPKQVADSSLSAVLFTRSTSVDKVYSYSRGHWQMATLTGGTLTEMLPGSGYAVRTTADTSVTISYRPVSPLDMPPTYELPAGWSLIGYSTLGLTQYQPVDIYLTSLAGNWMSLYTYDPATGYSLAKPGYGFSNVELFRGYWIYLRQPGTLVP